MCAFMSGNFVYIIVLLYVYNLAGMLHFQCLGHNEEHVWLLTFRRDSSLSSRISGAVARSVIRKRSVLYQQVEWRVWVGEGSFWMLFG